MPQRRSKKKSKNDTEKVKKAERRLGKLLGSCESRLPRGGQVQGLSRAGFLRRSLCKPAPLRLLCSLGPSKIWSVKLLHAFVPCTDHSG